MPLACKPLFHPGDFAFLGGDDRFGEFAHVGVGAVFEDDAGHGDGALMVRDHAGDEIDIGVAGIVDIHGFMHLLIGFAIGSGCRRVAGGGSAMAGMGILGISRRGEKDEGESEKSGFHFGHHLVVPKANAGLPNGKVKRVDRAAAELLLNFMLNQNSKLDQMFQALADPTRRAMIDRLSRGPASVSELAKPFDMSLPAVVQHLQALEASGLVSSQKVGRVRTCQIEPEALSQAEQWLNERRTLWVKRLDRLGEYLEATADEEEGK